MSSVVIYQYRKSFRYLLIYKTYIESLFVHVLYTQIVKITEI